MSAPTESLSQLPPPDQAGRSETAGDSGVYRYWAFISYSHRDAAWADWLHKQLELYRIPRQLVGRAGAGGEKIPPRLFPVFRDRDELPGAAELGGRLHEMLAASRNLIVICSPAAASSRWVNEEIKYFKSLGRVDRVFCLIVEGEPNAGGERECFPPAVRFRLAADGATLLTDQPIETLAPDARPQGDGRLNAKLKLVAGILDVGYDTLKQREKIRRLRHRLRLGALGAAATIALLLAYVGSADAGLGLPKGEAIRLWLDHHEITLFRPVRSQTVIREKAAAMRRELFDSIRNAQSGDGWMHETLKSKETNPPHDGWSQAQALCVLLRAPDVGNEALRPVLRGLDVFFRPGEIIAQNGVQYGWHGDPESGSPQAESLLWLAGALAEALGRPGLLEGEERQRYLGYFEQVQSIARLYHPGADGGWNMYPLQKKPAQHNTYSTTLALLALLETRRAGLPWEGSAGRRDELIRSTAGWLMAHYITEADEPGWGEGDTGTDNANRTIDGLTLQIYSELLRAEAEAGVAIAPRILADIPGYLAACVRRNDDYPVEKGEFTTRLLDPDGSEWREAKHETINFLWYPWAVDAASRWLARAERLGAPVEQRVRVQRALGHLVVDIGPEVIRKAQARWIFLAGEPLYGLSALALPGISGK